MFRTELTLKTYTRITFVVSFGIATTYITELWVLAPGAAQDPDHKASQAYKDGSDPMEAP